MKIGIFGESPYETDAMKALLENRHKQVRVVPMIKHLKGGQMLSAKAIKLFKAEMDLVEDYALVIAMHDLDAPPSDNKKKREIDEWFAQF